MNSDEPDISQTDRRIATMTELVAELCSERCAGRAPGTAGGAAARSIVVDALRAVGLDPREQEGPAGGRGANVLATLPGDIDRWVVLAAHFDHLGIYEGETYWGADDNAAAVAIVVEVARNLVAERAAGRGVVIAAFDAEEPPHFLTENMGSEYYARHPSAPLAQTDMMVCLDLVGHALGPEDAPGSVRNSVFALGAERSEGTAALVDELGDAERGVHIRRVDAEIIPAMSDYAAFWTREVPFLFLTNGRWRYYHHPEDKPERLDYVKMEATARWVERYVRQSCDREPAPFVRGARDDVSTLRSIQALTESFCADNAHAQLGYDFAAELLADCDAAGRLPEARWKDARMLLGLLERGLA